MSVRHFLSIADLHASELGELVQRTLQMKAGRYSAFLNGKVVGIYFTKTSTRTRTSFSTAALKLGAHIVAYGPGDLQLNTGETVNDTAAVLASCLDALVIRTAGPIAEMRAFAAQPAMAVVNAMSECEHPTQAISDLATLLEHFGTLQGVHVVYLGEGNNTATALALAIARTPRMRLSLFTPEGYGLPPAYLERARRYAAACNSSVEESHDLRLLPASADAVYATRWQTTGTSKPDPDWRSRFAPYAVTRELMARVSNGRPAMLLHDLPAVRGEDVEAAVLDGPQSLALTQAANKLFGAMAILEWCHTPVAAAASPRGSVTLRAAAK